MSDVVSGDATPCASCGGSGKRWTLADASSWDEPIIDSMLDPCPACSNPKAGELEAARRVRVRELIAEARQQLAAKKDKR